MNIKALSLIGIVLSTACSSPTTVHPDGTYDKLVWPQPKDALVQEGSWPSIDELQRVHPGETTKGQLFQMLGHPHFSEGLRAVREWNYLFHAKNTSGKTVTCQYKVIYNNKMVVTSTHWLPENCVLPYSVHFSADTLFAFDRWQLSDITPSGREGLERMLAKLPHHNQNVHIKVLGYTDRLGSEQHNLTLSQRRADTVKNYLVKQGVPEKNIVAEGRGESLTASCPNLFGSTLQNCLAPDRKVEIHIGE